MALSDREPPDVGRPRVWVRRASADDRARMVHVLARAFRDNPAMESVLRRSSEGRERMLRGIFPRVVDAYLKRGVCWGAEIGGALQAAMLTLPPGCYPLPLRFDLGVGLRMLCDSVGATVRFAKVDAMMRKRHIAHEHHYLFMIGTDPDYQGRGLGGALLRELNARAQESGHPCYLETDKPSSVSLYERNGYVVTSQEQAPLEPAPFTMWYMERPLGSRSPAP
jgi:ribosomal protein S18 acetylase RimI-like enzyme